MKSTGIVRQLDPLGRIVLPIEIRRTMELCPKDSIEIFVDGDRIILTKYKPTCVFCNSCSSLHSFKNKLVCNDCRTNLAIYQQSE